MSLTKEAIQLITDTALEAALLPTALVALTVQL